MDAHEIVDCLLEAELEPQDFDPEQALDRYSDAIVADQARGKITYQTALTCDRFYSRTERYAGRRNKPGGPYEARRNGATQTWKTRPGQFRIPIKIGFRQYGYIDNHNAAGWATRPDFQEAWEEYAEKTRKNQQATKIQRLQQQPLRPSS